MFGQSSVSFNQILSPTENNLGPYSGSRINESYQMGNNSLPPLVCPRQASVTGLLVRSVNPGISMASM